MKKILFYIVIYIPFILGIVLFSFNIINLFSSFCLFIGGYIAIKNTFDYRLVRKNNELINKVIAYNSYKTDNEIGDVKKIKMRKRERVRVRKK